MTKFKRINFKNSGMLGKKHLKLTKLFCTTIAIRQVKLVHQSGGAILLVIAWTINKHFSTSGMVYWVRT